MARKNRIVVEDGLYHVTARVAHKAFLLADEKVKRRIVTWMYGIADFAGIEIAAWNIMDSHLHILLRVPPVPERYWTDKETQPMAAWRSMRPAECRAPRWTPDPAGDSPSHALAEGDSPWRNAALAAGDSPSQTWDCPSREALIRAIADGIPAAVVPHPLVGFTMGDEEMLQRLEGLYRGYSDAAKKTAERWRRSREFGGGQLVEEEKARLCRRMYSVSQFMHTLKQRISEHFNRKLGHEGQLWDGRFHSTLVEKEDLAKLFVSSYIEWNAPKARIVAHPRQWKWCSYSVACRGEDLSKRVRRGYERLFGLPWEEIKARMDAVFADRLPDTWESEVYSKQDGRVGLRMSQLIKAVSLAHCAFFSRRREFVRETFAALPKRFPARGGAVVDFLARFDWDEPPRLAA